jgi:alpha-1,2-mannosyltransferase
VVAVLKIEWVLRLHAQSDLTVYAGAVSTLAGGGSLYDYISRAGPFTYPPFAGIVLFPLAFIPPPVARIAWTVLTAVAVIGTVVLVARSVRLRSRYTPVFWPLATIAVLLSKPIHSNLRFGQVSLLLALLVLVDLFALEGRRAQGLLTGLCAAMKLTPLIFVPYLWITGRRRAAGLAVGTFVLVSVMSAEVLPGESIRFWTERVFENSTMRVLSYIGNQSLYAGLLRMELSPQVVTIVWMLGSVAIVLVGLRRAERAWEAGQWLTSVAIVGCAGVLVSPISWTHHRLWLLLPAAATFGTKTRTTYLVRAVILTTMLIPFPRLSWAGPLAWYLQNAELLLALGIACFLPATGSARVPPDRTAKGVFQLVS